MIAVFVIAGNTGPAHEPERVAALSSLLGRLPGRTASRIMLADRAPANQPFAADGPGPDLVLQIGFADRAGAEAALSATSALSDLPALLATPASAITLQVMEVHAFPVETAPGPEPFCTFFVTYPGTTADLPGWLAHYDAHHPPIMRRFPGIREVETYWPMAFNAALPFARGTAMQRNKVVFDSLEGLVAALASPVMDEMRADGRGFAPMSAKATHFPMRTWRVP